MSWNATTPPEIRPPSSRSGAALTRMGILRPSGCCTTSSSPTIVRPCITRPTPHARTSTGEPSRVVTPNAPQ